MNKLDIENFLRKHRMTQLEFALLVQVHRNTVTNWIKGAPIPERMASHIVKMMNDWEAESGGFHNEIKSEGEVKDLGSINITDTTPTHTTKGGNTHYLVNENIKLLDVHLVTPKAQAGYLSNWADPEYIESLPTIKIMVEKIHTGTYRAFEVSGDSMCGSEGGPNQVFEGETVVGRLLTHNFWKYKLHIRDNPLWIIVHEEGVLIKHISDHDVENRTITLHSWSEDKNTYPDRVINLADVLELYNVVQKITKY